MPQNIGSSARGRALGGLVNIENPSNNKSRSASALNLEGKIGIKVFVWLGGIALAGAGILLVKYSIDQGWINPAVRIILGILLGLTFLALGESTRKHASRVSQAFSAAGISDLYASFLAAHHLYHLIGAPTAFFFLACTTAVAVLLSMRQGMITAILGLLGGYLTPIWISTAQQDLRPLFLYLILLHSGLYIVARARRWWQLAFLTLLASSFWVSSWFFDFTAGNALFMGLFILFSIISVFFLTQSKNSESPLGNDEIDAGLRWLAILSGLLQMFVLGVLHHYASLEWVLLGIIGSGLLILGRRNKTYLHLSWFALGLSAALLVMWSIEARVGYLTTAFAIGSLFAIVSYLAMWGSEKPVHYSVFSVCSAVSFFMVSYLPSTLEHKTLPWGIISMLCGAVYVLAAVPVIRRKENLIGDNQILAAFALGATTFLSLAIPIQFEKESLAVAWSLEALALFWLSSKLRVPIVRIISGVVAILSVGQLILSNQASYSWYWLIYANGIPMVAFWLSALLSEKEQRKNFTAFFQSLAIFMAFWLCTLEVHHAFGREISEGFLSVAEAGGLSASWILLAFFLRALGESHSTVAIRRGMNVILAVAMLQTTFSQFIFGNPLWIHIPVGNVPVVNDLLMGYGAPAVLYLFLARFFTKPGEDLYRKLSGGLSILLFFLLVNLEIRQFFHGSYLDVGTTHALENYAYSLTWVLFASFLIVIGMVKRSIFIRYCSLGIMLVAVVKVFLYDTGHLNDLYRVLSFLGLGLSLLLIAYLYQRILFKTESIA
jgi:uncharacterized membrane protein